MANLEFAFGDTFESNYNDFNNSFSYIDIDESELLHRRHISKDILFDNDEIQIEVYKFDTSHLDYITNYIYPFWKLEFLNNYINKNKEKDNSPLEFNPYSTWSNTELAKHNMGLKDNTICFELKSSDVSIGFCTILLLDNFDREGFNSPFSDPIYEDSIVFYNYLIEKPFRGKGYGKIFIHQILNYINFINNNYKYIVLYVDKDNKVAIDIYEKNGFKYICENPKNNLESIYKLTL